MLATHLFAAALAFPGNKFDVKAITDRNKKGYRYRITIVRFLQ